MTYSHAQHIIAAFCYVAAAMIWSVGGKLIYYGVAPLWFVCVITALFVASGISFDLDGVIKKAGAP